MAAVVYFIYNFIAVFIIFLCALNFRKSNDFQEEILYVLLAVPFILRVFQIK
jgi:hypothetical protein